MLVFGVVGVVVGGGGGGGGGGGRDQLIAYETTNFLLIRSKYWNM